MQDHRLNSLLVILLVSLLVLSNRVANASLIGDTVYGHDSAYFSPGIYETKEGYRYLDGIVFDVLFEPTQIGPIQSGDADATMVPAAGGPIYNFEESGFTLSLDQTISQWGDNFGGQFNGIVITDINNSPSARISGFTLTNEMYLYDGTQVAFTADRISYTDDSVSLDFHGLTLFDGYISVDLQFTAVPVPASVWLFGSGMAVLIGLARVRNGAELKRLR